MLERVLSDKNIKKLAKETADILHRGGAVIFPTDTLYALGVDALSGHAIDLFFSLKKRPAHKPIPIFVKDIEAAKKIAFINKRQEDILEQLWPGAFTIVLEKKNVLSQRLSAGEKTIGLRVPDSVFCKDLLAEFDGPITASSANISGMEPLLDIDEIIKQFNTYSQLPHFIIDAGVLPASEPSTVINITGKKPKVLRFNSATEGKLKKIFGKDIVF